MESKPGSGSDGKKEKQSIGARLRSAESVLFGLMLGIAAAVIGMGAYYELKGLHYLNSWERSFEERHLERTGGLMLAQIDLAIGSLTDERPLKTSEFLAGDLAHRHYDHHIAYAAKLLQRGEVDLFNQLRYDTSFIVFDLSHHDFSSLNLEGINLRGVLLENTDLSGCNLKSADLSLAEATDANFTGADLSEAILFQSNLAGAILTGIKGRRVDFREAILANTSMMTISELSEAHFGGAHLVQANLWQSTFTDAIFDQADMTIVSAVDADLSTVRSMSDVILTGANLSKARIDVDKMARAWFVNAEGLSRQDIRGLQAMGGIAEREDVLDLVDRRIVGGFRAQIEEDETIKPEERQPTLINMLQSYYMQ
jgi:uncharacterized protein YjbI with pentapeptide repeats